MKTYVRHVDKMDDASLASLFEKEHEAIMASKSVLIQIFSGDEKTSFEKLLTFFKNEFPHATLIAASTDGEICNSKVLTGNSVVSLSIFEKTTLRSAYMDKKDSFENGVAIAKALVTSETKLLISFADGLHCDGEEFLNGIYSVAPDVKVAGGLSGDNAKFINCFVGEDSSFYDRGAVAVALDSKTLQVDTLYKSGWEPVGIQHTVTDSYKNRVYTIDGISAVDFYKKYLGSETAGLLPQTGVEFPLIIVRDNLKIARACLGIHEDGSLSFAGDISQGSDVFIGIGEVDEILKKPSRLDEVQCETFFIYSCMARRRFIADMIEVEIENFSKLAPTSGFFTYGEFYTSLRPKLLNQTLTAVGLSESKEHKMIIETKQKNIQKSSNSKKLSALMHILNATTQELKNESKKILDEKRELEAKNNSLNLIQETAHLGSWEVYIQTGEIKWSDESFKIYKRDPAQGTPSYQEFVTMVVEEDRKNLIKAQKALLQDKNIHSAKVRIKRGDGKIITIIESGKLIEKNGKPYKIVGTSLDITMLEEKGNILMQQSKLAQMGEMINMIAHQWRQPLNAISAASIKLSMMNEMDMLTSEEIKNVTTFIEDVSQDMSKTIDDFMNFTKPTDKKEVVFFEELIDEIMHLMHAQLKNHNITFIKEIEDNLSVLTYKKDLEHVLINLFSNARDAFDEKEIENKELRVKIYEKEEKCIIEVSDNAGGIKESDIEKIFNPYFTTKEQGKGTGLGLYMSKKILKEVLEGTIKVENIKNGAKFTITLAMCHDT